MKNQTVKTLKVGKLNCKYNHVKSMIRLGHKLCSDCGGYGDIPNGFKLNWWLRSYVERFKPCSKCEGTGFTLDVCLKQWTGKRMVNHG